MRRLLKKVVQQEIDLGDTSTLVDQTIIDQIRALTLKKSRLLHEPMG